MQQQIKTINVMDKTTYEKKKERVTLLINSSNETDIIAEWNKFIDGIINSDDDKFNGCCRINKLNAETLSCLFEIVSKKDIIRSLMSGDIDPTNDKYFIVTDTFTVIGATDFWDFINIDTLLVFLESTKKPYLKWEDASKNAIVLWNTPYECVKLEISRDYVKFYRRDDMLTCYTYPPLHELKKDKEFIECAKSILMESNQYHITEFTDWVNGNYDMPPFPLSCIFASDYQSYKFHDFNEE